MNFINAGAKLPVMCQHFYDNNVNNLSFTDATCVSHAIHTYKLQFDQLEKKIRTRLHLHATILHFYLVFENFYVRNAFLSLF